MAALASPTAATVELPLYLQMSRYTKGSKAVMELRTQRFLAEQGVQTDAQTGVQAPNATGTDEAADDQLVTGSIGDTTDADGYSFNDLLDTINPLQHLPFISALYRDLTGDEIKPAARVVGGAIFGGPVGAGLAIADAVLEQASGTDSGGHIMALLNGEPSPQTSDDENVFAAVPQTPANRAPENAFAANALTVPGNLPSLSADAFNALLTVAPQDGSPILALRGSVPPLAPPNDISVAMRSALDMYSALKEDQRR